MKPGGRGSGLPISWCIMEKMDLGRTLMLLVAICDLGMAYMLFTNEQYLSLAASLGIFALAAISFSIFISLWSSGRAGGSGIAIAALASLLIGIYEISFELESSMVLFAILHSSLFVIAGATLSGLLAYAAGRAIGKAKGLRLCVAIIAVAAVITILAFSVMYIAHPVALPVEDEVIYTYYASYLFVHGQNPYVSGMGYINRLYGTVPTPLLNGNYENYYGYPALSFIAFSFVPLLGLRSLSSSSAQSFNIYTALGILLDIITVLVIYRRSGYDRKALLACWVWLVVAFGFISSTTYSLALLLVVIAYMERHRKALSAVLLGLAASTIQLVWFLLPFFYIFSLREGGWKAAAKAIAISAITFIIVNSYYLLFSAPQFLTSVFGLLGLHPVVFYGADILQLSTAFYPLPYWYAGFATASVFLLMMALFYAYGKSLAPLLAISAMLISFLSWRNISQYGIAVIPLVIAIYFCADGIGRKDQDLLKSRRPAAYAAAALVVLLLAVAIYAHDGYVSKQGISINGVVPRISYVQGGNFFVLLGLNISASNKEAVARNVSFFIVSKDPNYMTYALGGSFPELASGSSAVYETNETLVGVSNGTQLFITAFTDDYMVSRQLNLTVKAPGR